jgi:hypothetical protein
MTHVYLYTDCLTIDVNRSITSRFFSTTCLALAHNRAYSFGCDMWLVEIDVVLPADMPLSKAHDVGEELQVCV